MMTSMLTDENTRVEKLSFWRRQFARHRSEQQDAFDVVFGLAAPLLCFYFDPIVFRGDLMGQAILQPYQLFAYGVTAVEVLLFVNWLLFGSRLANWSWLIGGALINGSVFSAVVGLVILPYSLMGLLVGIGLLGFVPFVTTFVYLRVGWRALQNGSTAPATSWMNALIIGAILSLAIPALMSLSISRAASHSIDVILHGSSQEARVAVAHLQRLPFIPQQYLEPIVQAYLLEKDPKRREILKNSYQVLTSEDIENRIAILND